MNSWIVSHSYRYHFTIILVVQMFLIKLGLTTINIPKDDQGPLNISMKMIIEDVNSISPLTMDFRLEFFLIHKWNTTNGHCRLARQSIESRETIETNGKSIILRGNNFKSVWVPDTFFYNAKKVGPTTYDDGYKSLSVQFFGLDQCSFTYSLRLSALIPCPMNFRWYPVDKQICRVSLRSGSYSSDQINYSWVPKGVIVEPRVNLLQHSMKINFFQSTATVHDQDLFTWLIVDLTFNRIISYYVLQIYLPTVILVIISYCSLWMGFDYIAGRITLGVTTQLALITQFSGLKSRLPPVSYINALDVWMLCCMIFVFTTILITTIIIVINQYNLLFKRIANNECMENQSKSKNSTKLRNNQLNKISSPANNHSLWSTGQNDDTIKSRMMLIGTNDVEQSTNQLIGRDYQLTNIHYQAEKVDQVLRTIYLIFFFLFNCIYWSTLLFLM